MFSVFCIGCAAFAAAQQSYTHNYTGITFAEGEITVNGKKKKCVYMSPSDDSTKPGLSVYPQEGRVDIRTMAVEKIGDTKIKTIGDVKRYLESAPYGQQPVSLQEAGPFDVPFVTGRSEKGLDQVYINFLNTPGAHENNGGYVEWGNGMWGRGQWNDRKGHVFTGWYRNGMLDGPGFVYVQNGARYFRAFFVAGVPTILRLTTLAEGNREFLFKGGKLESYSTSKAPGKIFKPVRDIEFMELMEMYPAQVDANVKEYNPNAATNGLEYRSRSLQKIYMPAYDLYVPGTAADVYDKGKYKHTDKIEYYGNGAGYTLKGPLQCNDSGLLTGRVVLVRNASSGYNRSEDVLFIGGLKQSKIDGPCEVFPQAVNPSRMDAGRLKFEANAGVINGPFRFEPADMAGNAKAAISSTVSNVKSVNELFRVMRAIWRGTYSEVIEQKYAQDKVADLQIQLMRDASKIVEEQLRAKWQILEAYDTGLEGIGAHSKKFYAQRTANRVYAITVLLPTVYDKNLSITGERTYLLNGSYKTDRITEPNKKVNLVTTLTSYTWTFAMPVAGDPGPSANFNFSISRPANDVFVPLRVIIVVNK